MPACPSCPGFSIDELMNESHNYYLMLNNLLNSWWGGRSKIIYQSTIDREGMMGRRVFANILFNYLKVMSFCHRYSFLEKLNY
jgi:hypothetical protein